MINLIGTSVAGLGYVSHRNCEYISKSYTRIYCNYITESSLLAIVQTTIAFAKNPSVILSIDL